MHVVVSVVVAAAQAHDLSQWFDGGQRAAYPAPLLAALVTANRSTHGFAFVQPPSRGAPGVLRGGAGGAAVLAALALCESVDLYGFGVFTAGLAEDKVYGHFYDGLGAAPRCSAVTNATRLGLELGDRNLWPEWTDSSRAFTHFRREIEWNLFDALGIMNLVRDVG